jgi:peptidoglycan/xylan/chitin deacetylase (PgdA/CDA1 family)
MNFKLPNTIINFHVIKDIEWMERILLLLKRHYNFINLDELESFYYGNLKLKNACHITVDDGDKSVYNHLFPLIKKHNIPISIYVSPKSVKTGSNFWFQEIKGYDYRKLLECMNEINHSKIKYRNDYQVHALLKSQKSDEIYGLIDFYRERFGIQTKERIGMNLEQLLELQNSGLVEIGAHSQTHPILKNESEEKVILEIKDSIKELSEMLGKKVRSFAYPNGIPGLDFTEREIEILKKCDIKLAFSTEKRRFNISDNALSIPRNGISKGSPSFILTKLVIGDYWSLLRKFLMGKQEVDYR